MRSNASPFRPSIGQASIPSIAAVVRNEPRAMYTCRADQAIELRLPFVQRRRPCITRHAIERTQIDAHTDLRDEYEGTEYSHASVMARVLGRVDIVSVGIRALTSEERELVRSRDDVTMFLADEIHGRHDWIDEVVGALGDDVYITFDVDALDPSLVPTTGTPEPGGLDWYDSIRLLRKVFERRNVLGADVVELAPSPGQPAPEFLIAKLVYKMIGYRFAPGSMR